MSQNTINSNPAFQAIFNHQAFLALVDDIIMCFSQLSHYNGPDFHSAYFISPQSIVNFTEKVILIEKISQVGKRASNSGKELQTFTGVELADLRGAAQELVITLEEMRKLFQSALNANFDASIAQAEKNRLEEIFDTNYQLFMAVTSPVLSLMQENEVQRIGMALNKLIDQEAKKGFQPFSQYYKCLACQHEQAADNWLFVTFSLIAVVLGLGYQSLTNAADLNIGDTFKFTIYVMSKLFVFGLSTGVILWGFSNYRLNKHNQLLNKQKELSIKSFSEFSNSTAFDDTIRKIVLGRISKTIFDNNRFGYIDSEKAEIPDTNALLNSLLQITQKDK